MYFTPGTAVEYLSCMHRRQCIVILPMLIPVCHNVSFMHSHWQLDRLSYKQGVNSSNFVGEGQLRDNASGV